MAIVEACVVQIIPVPVVQIPEDKAEVVGPPLPVTIFVPPCVRFLRLSAATFAKYA